MLGTDVDPQVAEFLAIQNDLRPGTAAAAHDR